MTQFVEINGNMYRVGRNTNWSMTGFEEKSKNVKKSQIDFLKSCPFCGWTEIHTYEPTVYEPGNDASVNCESPICGAEVRGRTLKEAIAKWNRRVKK